MREEIEKIAWLLAGSLVDPKITVEQATDQILTLLEKEIQKARVEEIELLKSSLTFGKKVDKETWLNFNIDGYFEDRIKQLEKE